MSVKKIFTLTAVLAALTGMSLARASVTIPVYMTSTVGQGKNIGTIEAQDSFCGVLLKPNLHDLPPGIHGFHIHVKPDCGNNGLAAGGHLDPQNTDQHLGPYNKHGHLGDMPVLIVNQDGTANLPTLAPRFRLAAMKGHAFMIHAGGDNYSDKPEKLGGGGARIACGIIS